MISSLPEWYRIASIQQFTQDTLEKRSTAIEKFAKRDTHFILNCVRMFVGKKVESTFFDDLNSGFQISDSMFPMSNNDLELRVLCGAIVHTFIIGKPKDRVLVALALITGTFGVGTASLINTDIIETAQRMLQENSFTVRQQKKIAIGAYSGDQGAEDLAQTAKSIKGIVDYLKSLTNNFNNAVQKISVLEEECDIHWWLFREYSDLKGAPIDQLKIKSAPIIVGLELAGLTRFIPGLFPGTEYLSKALSSNSKEEISMPLKEAVNELLQEGIDLTSISNGNSNMGNLCPVHFAIMKALETEDTTSWIASFEKYTSISATYKVKRIELAAQCYHEKLLIINSIQ